eukprot:Lithocolla_globosa_v1_NODE_1737_length_2368_cov_6.677182.p1 type:complete len:254 gc:universal NODE_1737_length_2368_cov_6.677182:1067-306(-)
MLTSIIFHDIAMGEDQHHSGCNLLTKVRWVVEAYHGRMKKWKFFANRQSNYHCVREETLVRIVSATMNAYRPPLSSEKPGDKRMAEKMLEKAKETTNPVEQRVLKGPLSNRGKWISLSGDGTELDGFPTYTEEELKEEVFYGSYQRKQAESYCDEHHNTHGYYEVQCHKQAPDLLRFKMQSRHKNSAKYFLWVSYTSDKVTGWYCQCGAGRRTVGCCAHIAAVIWYLSCARHNKYKPKDHKWWEFDGHCQSGN